LRFPGKFIWPLFLITVRLLFITHHCVKYFLSSPFETHPILGRLLITPHPKSQLALQVIPLQPPWQRRMFQNVAKLTPFFCKLPSEIQQTWRK